MKISDLPVVMGILASSASAIESRPPPNNITPHLVPGWQWADPFPATESSSFEASCEATKHFYPLEYTLHDLMNDPPDGLAPWSTGLKKFFKKREYPGGWSGYDRHGYDRTILKMDYKEVPLELRKWIEEQERTEGEGKGLFGIFRKATGSQDEIADVVEISSDVDRSQDEDKVAIFAPGAIYHVLPLWVAEESECRDELLDLSNYKPIPGNGNVVGWPEHKRPKYHKAEFKVTVQALKEKAAISVSEGFDDDSKSEL